MQKTKPKVTKHKANHKRQTLQTLDKSSKVRVCAYARVSTDKDDQLNSLDAQITYYKEKIPRTANWQYCGIYYDEGITGLVADKRKGFLNMIADAKAGKFDYIITKAVSRFGRNTVDILKYTRLMKDIGVGVKFENENIDTNDSTGETMLSIFASLAQDFSRNLSESVKWGKQRGYEKGVASIPTSSFLGYKRSNKGEIIVDEDEAWVVRYIYEWFIKGRTCRAIADELNEMQAPTPIPKGTKRKRDGVETIVKGVWYANTVESIVTNEKYKGDHRYRKTYCADYLTKKMVKNEGENEVDWYYAEDTHPAIISPSQWQIAQEEYLYRQENAIMLNGKNPFVGRVYCGECGTAFGRKVWGSFKEDKTYRREVYQCNGKYKGKGSAVCQSPNLKEHELQQAFVDEWNRWFSHKAEVSKAIGEIIAETFDEVDYDTQIESVNLQIDALEQQLGCGLPTDEVLKLGEKLKRLERKRKRLINSADAQDEARPVFISRQTRAKEIATRLQDQTAPLDEWNEELFVRMVKRMTVNTDGSVAVELKISDDLARLEARCAVVNMLLEHKMAA